MELKINKETVPAADRVFDGIQEQSIELDYILPDYCPDIFRLVRCEVIPVITDHSISGDRLSYELRCDIRILYCSEANSLLQCVSQRQSFSRSAELGKICDDPRVKITAKTGHMNFRAVNKRRLDLRGAVSVKIEVTGESSQEVISDIFGMNVQTKKIPVRFAAKKINTDKTLQLSEETELTPAQPDIVSIISCRCKAPECEKKMISGKLLAKGEAEVEILYSCERDGEGAIEPMSFTLPYSQIIDIDEIDDSYECTVIPEAVCCDVTPASGKSGENRSLRCELELHLHCRAVKTADLMIAEDAYSTVYPCTATAAEIRADQTPTVYSESIRHSARIAEGEGIPQTIYAMWCTPKNINTRLGEDGHSVVISGMLTYSMAVKDTAGSIAMPDKDEAFEETVSLNDDISGCTVSSVITVREVSYNISSDGVLTAKADISARISVNGCSAIKALTDIAVDDSAKKERDGDYAIKLYFGTENEEVWEIAKRYSTCVSAIMEENELDGDRLESGTMLLIPIVT